VACRLGNQAAVHHDDLVAHGQRFALVVRHVGHGELQALLQCPDFLAHFASQPGVQVGQRLVKQQHRRLQHQRARQRHTLLLPAREFAGQPVVKADQSHVAQRLYRAAAGGILGHARHAQTVHHVLQHIHVREQRIALEHHAHVALGRAQGGDVLPRNEDLPGGGRLQPGDHAQRSGLAAARGPKDGGERAARHLEADALDGQWR
jgi:hypothetical protein